MARWGQIEGRVKELIRLKYRATEVRERELAKSVHAQAQAARIAFAAEPGYGRLSLSLSRK